ncbi:hypothetical protein [Streptomyces sp. NPDC055189]
MTDLPNEWRLLNGSALMGTIIVDEADMPWPCGRFPPEPGFNRFRPWFDKANASIEAEEFERFDKTYDRIEDALTLLPPSGPVSGFLLRIDQDRAWFR